MTQFCVIFSVILNVFFYLKLLNDIKIKQNNILLESENVNIDERSKKILNCENLINKNFDFNVKDEKLIQFFNKNIKNYF